MPRRATHATFTVRIPLTGLNGRKYTKRDMREYVRAALDFWTIAEADDEAYYMFGPINRKAITVRPTKETTP